MRVRTFPKGFRERERANRNRINNIHTRVVILIIFFLLFVISICVF